MEWYYELTLVQKCLTWLFISPAVLSVIASLYIIFVEAPARHRRIMQILDDIAKDHREIP